MPLSTHAPEQWVGSGFWILERAIFFARSVPFDPQGRQVQYTYRTGLVMFDPPTADPVKNNDDFGASARPPTSDPSYVH